MDFLLDVLREALAELTRFGPELAEVLWLTLAVSGIATLLGVIFGFPLGLWLGLARFPGRRFLLALVHTGMGMPPVLAGLFLLLLLWRDGPLGSWGLLFTPAAMVAAQTLLAVPIAAGVVAGAVAGLPPSFREQMHGWRIGGVTQARLALREIPAGRVAAVAASFGRVVSEVGAVLVVGGNIAGETRVLTTAIVQEARQARFGTALAFGILLLLVAVVVNVFLLRSREAAS